VVGFGQGTGAALITDLEAVDRLRLFSSLQCVASIPGNKSLIAGGRPGAVMSAVEDLAGRFLEPGGAAERGVDHDPAHNEPEAPAPIEGVRLLYEAVRDATHEERSENQEQPILNMEMVCVEVGIDRRPVMPVGCREDPDKQSS
jgi:hypothetical protein